MAHQHVDELRQLVEIVFAEQLADRSQPRILLDVKLRPVRLVLRLKLGLKLFGILAHRSKLDAREISATPRFALVRKKPRPSVVQPDCQHDDRVKPKRQQQHRGTESDVEGA